MTTSFIQTYKITYQSLNTHAPDVHSNILISICIEIMMLEKTNTREVLCLNILEGQYAHHVASYCLRHFELFQCGYL